MNAIANSMSRENKSVNDYKEEGQSCGCIDWMLFFAHVKTMMNVSLRTYGKNEFNCGCLSRGLEICSGKFVSKVDFEIAYVFSGQLVNSDSDRCNFVLNRVSITAMLIFSCAVHQRRHQVCGFAGM